MLNNIFTPFLLYGGSLKKGWKILSIVVAIFSFGRADGFKNEGGRKASSVVGSTRGFLPFPPPPPPSPACGLLRVI